MENTPSNSCSAGGSPGQSDNKSIPLCVPQIEGNAWEYVKQCLDDNWVSSAGPFVDRFEKMVAEFVGAKHAVAVVNGTAALHTALLIAGVEPDDEVLVSSLTFIASANAVRYAGAWPIFIDAEPAYWQIDTQQVSDFLHNDCTWKNGALYNNTTGRRVRAVMPVHILGHPVEMDPLLEVARKFDLVVVNDSAEALGTRYKNRKMGEIGDVSCFSFNGNKLITTGGGGIVATDNDVWAERARYLTTQAKDDPVEYVHKNMGFNYRLTNVQAALGCAQMESVEACIAAKRRIAAAYMATLAEIPGFTSMTQAPWAFSTFWMYTLLVDEKQYCGDSRDLLHFLHQKGIQSRPLWQPMHASPSFANLPKRQCPVAERLYRQSISLPCSVGLTPDQQLDVVRAIRESAAREYKQSA